MAYIVMACTRRLGQQWYMAHILRIGWCATERAQEKPLVFFTSGKQRAARNAAESHITVRALAYTLAHILARLPAYMLAFFASI